MQSYATYSIPIYFILINRLSLILDQCLREVDQPHLSSKAIIFIEC